VAGVVGRKAVGV